MIYILHVSDLHFVNNAVSSNSETILYREAVRKAQSIPQGKKLLIISGDFHNYWESNYDKAQSFITRLVSEMGLEMSKDVFVVPGNHDVGNDNSLKTALQNTDPQWKMHSKAAITMIKNGELEFLEERLRVFKPYNEFVHRLGIYDANDGLNTPAKTHVRSWRGQLNILHLNTAIIADGKSKSDQMTDVDSAAREETWHNFYASNIPAIAIGHNNYFDLVDKQRKDLATVFALRNVSAYLCGDNHLTETEPERQMIRIEAGAKQGAEIPNLVAARGIGDGNDSFSEIGYCWHLWDEVTGKVTVEFRKWTRENLAKTVINGEPGEYYMHGDLPVVKNIHLEKVSIGAISQDTIETDPSQQESTSIQSTKQLKNKHSNPDSNVTPLSKQSLLSIQTQLRAGKTQVSFGSYCQAMEGRKQPIVWNVLFKNDDRCLLLSKHVLESISYNSGWNAVTWETSTLRYWLNENFFTKAFTVFEQSLIIPSKIITDNNPYYATYPGQPTIDKVFLLSMQEAEKYLSSNRARQCRPTTFAKSQGAFIGIDTKESNGCCLWWLRSPGFNSGSATYVDRNGKINSHGNSVNYDYVGVRPAFWISLQ